MNWRQVDFLLSAASPAQFLPEAGIVMAGRSNVGKSSAINCLLERKNMARVGDTPGKTAHVNYFLVDNRLTLVDLPGYGYAKVSQVEKRRWDQLMESFFAVPERIALGVVIVDARHTPSPLDIQMASYFQQTCQPFLVLANKADKLKKSEWAAAQKVIGDTLVLDRPCILFSAKTGQGRAETRRAIESYGTA